VSVYLRRWRRRLAPLLNAYFRSRSAILSSAVQKAIASFWCQERNFGDRLAPVLTRHYGLIPVYTPVFESCRLVSIGSNLDIVPDSYRGAILGGGFLHETSRRAFANANILALRGRLSARAITPTYRGRLGDPGIIVDRIYRRELATAEKRWRMGIVPHYKDDDHPSVRQLHDRHRDEVTVIDVRRPPRTVVLQIAACRHVVSSSLHGLVVAHSLGIPATPATFSGGLRGGTFKFRDYYSAYDVEPVMCYVSGNEDLQQLEERAVPAPEGAVAAAKTRIHQAFQELRSSL